MVHYPFRLENNFSTNTTQENRNGFQLTKHTPVKNFFEENGAGNWNMLLDVPVDNSVCCLMDCGFINLK